jgi:hypothetical protein
MLPKEAPQQTAAAILVSRKFTVSQRGRRC